MFRGHAWARALIAIGGCFAAACAAGAAQPFAPNAGVLSQPGVAAVGVESASEANRPDTAQEPAPVDGAETTNDSADVARAEPRLASLADTETTDASESRGPVVDPKAAELCSAYCDRLEQRCASTVAEECRINCGQYQRSEGECSKYAHAALACAKDTPDPPCVHIAPSACADEFRRWVACTEGREIEERSAELEIPRDWQRVEVDGASIPMPLGVEQHRDGSRLELVANEGSARYSVTVLPAPAQPLTQKNATAATLRVLGRCTRNLRVFGVIERPGHFSSQFSSRCPDGNQRQGRLIVSDDHLFVLSVDAAPGASVTLEPFLFGFEPAR